MAENKLTETGTQTETKKNDLPIISETKTQTKRNDLPIISETKTQTKRNDFVEIKYTGYSQGQIFDSNIEEDLKKLSEKEKPRKTRVIIGQRMVVSGLDNALENKEIGKEYKIRIKPEEAFGERKKELVRIIPMKTFSEKKVYPRPGMVFALDNNLVKVIAVSGARVTVDFNNPLAGKEIEYRFIIIRKITEDKEKTETFFEGTLRFVPEFEVKEDAVVIKGQKIFESFVKAFDEKFKEFVGKGLKFELKEEKKEQPNEQK